MLVTGSLPSGRHNYFDQLLEYYFEIKTWKKVKKPSGDCSNFWVYWHVISEYMGKDFDD